MSSPSSNDFNTFIASFLLYPRLIKASQASALLPETTLVTSLLEGRLYAIDSTLSESSSAMRSAVFLPIPFALDMKAVSLDAIALASSSTVLTDKSASEALALYAKADQVPRVLGGLRLWLRREIQELIKLDENIQRKEFFMMIFADSVKSLEKNRQDVMSLIGTGRSKAVRAMEKEKKLKIVRKLCNMNTLLLPDELMEEDVFGEED